MRHALQAVANAFAGDDRQEESHHAQGGVPDQRGGVVEGGGDWLYVDISEHASDDSTTVGGLRLAAQSRRGAGGWTPVTRDGGRSGPARWSIGPPGGEPEAPKGGCLGGLGRLRPVERKSIRGLSIRTVAVRPGERIGGSKRFKGGAGAGRTTFPITRAASRGALRDGLAARAAGEPSTRRAKANSENGRELWPGAPDERQATRASGAASEGRQTRSEARLPRNLLSRHQRIDFPGRTATDL